MKTLLGLAALIAGGWLMYAIVTGQDILPTWFKNALAGGVLTNATNGPAPAQSTQPTQPSQPSSNTPPEKGIHS